MNVRSSRVVPLPKDATPDQIVELCTATADLVAFRAALRWFEADDWPEARSRLERALLEETGAQQEAGSLVGERIERGRLAARFHKMQLLKAEDTARRSNDQRDRRKAAEDVVETAAVEDVPESAP